MLLRRQLMPVGLDICGTCSDIKPVDDFVKCKKHICLECSRKKSRMWFDRVGREHKKEYRQRPEVKANHREYQKTPAQRENRQRNEQKREKSNPNFKLYKRVKTRLHSAMVYKKDNRHWFGDILPYTVNDLWAHLESQFEPWMTRENYGSEWHVDHTIPVSAFNFDSTDDIDFHRCWDLSNLRPLAAEENLRKRDKIDKPFQPSLKLKL